MLDLKSHPKESVELKFGILDLNGNTRSKKVIYACN